MMRHCAYGNAVDSRSADMHVQDLHGDAFGKRASDVTVCVAFSLSRSMPPERQVGCLPVQAHIGEQLILCEFAVDVSFAV